MTRFQTILAIFFLATLPALMGGYALAVDVANDHRQDVLTRAANNCNVSTNILAAETQIGLDGPGEGTSKSILTMPIQDCYATFFENGGIPVPLSDSETNKYIAIVKDGLIPVVRGGEVIEGESFELTDPDNED